MSLTLSADQLWQSVLGEMELVVSRANFTTWLKSTFIVEWRGGEIVVGVPNGFTQNWLEKKYHKPILQALEHITERQVQRVTYRIVSHRGVAPVMVTITTESSAPVLAPVVEASRAREPAPRFGLQPHYIFDTFVVGKGNELAHAACRAVADIPGKKYNPLFIYGGVGLGKTHLMQAIGHALLQLHPDWRVLYCSAEKFTSDFVKAIREGRMDEFKSVYRTPDVLLIDDVQFIAGKEGTQEEFFHTFNEFHQQQRQLVMTSDRPPKSIPALEERLTSRFEWGMIADIAMPDLETRLAILQAKMRERRFQLEREVLQFLAESIQHNVRELEGALNKIMAHCELTNVRPNLEVVRNILSTITFSGLRGLVTVQQLLQHIAEFYEISLDDLTGGCRKKELVGPRQIAMYLMREELDISYPSIGHELGGRDHTTAMHAYQKISRGLTENTRLKQEVDMIRQKLYQGQR